MSFEDRKLEVTFQLGKGNFGESGFNTVTLKGLRMSATVSYGGGISYSQLSLTVYGMTLSSMNELVTLGTPISRVRLNLVTLTAQSGNGSRSIVFKGIINNAWVNTQGIPDVSLVVTAYTGLLDAMKPAQSTSVKGTADVATLMSGWASQMGYAFENNGVDVKLANPYYPGTVLAQVQACARAAEINYTIDKTTLAIWPRDGFRLGTVPLISKDTGMVGYPSFTQTGISLRTIYDPTIVFMGKLNVQSQITPVSGIWQPYMIVHDLESQMPGGKWFTQMECVQLGQSIPV